MSAVGLIVGIIPLSFFIGFFAGFMTEITKGGLTSIKSGIEDGFKTGLACLLIGEAGVSAYLFMLWSLQNL